MLAYEAEALWRILRKTVKMLEESYDRIPSRFNAKNYVFRSLQNLKVTEKIATNVWRKIVEQKNPSS
ncbi:MAG: hypothetical protein ACTSYM_09350 [Candidatus Baldrarchaeia archaeon]